MEIQSLQKGFLEKDSPVSVNDRNVFIRKTFGLLLLEYIFVSGISLLTLFIDYNGIIWVFGVLMFICQLCHFYFEFSQQIGQGQNNQMLNYISIFIYLICLTFTFSFFWLLMIQIILAEAWIANLQLGLVILFLSFYTNITETHFQTATSWIIVMVTPITIEFIIHFFYEFWLYPGSQLQPFITIIITWYCCFMLQISQDFIIERDFSFDQIQIATCKLLGAQYQIIVNIIKFFINRNNNQNNLIQSNQNEKFEYFRQVTAMFITFIVITLLYVIYGRLGFMIEYFSNGEILFAYFKPIFWVSLSFSIVLYYLILVLHRNVNYIIKWALFLTQFVFNLFVIIGVTDYLVYNNYNVEENDQSDYFFYDLQKHYLMEIAFCMFAGIGIGLQSYSLIYKDNIDYMKAIIFGMICPILIFISQIYYISFTQDNAQFVGYVFAILVVFTAYLCLIIYELHQQMNSDKIDFDTKEYYLGAMVIFQPIKTITIRVTSLFI